MFSHLNTLIGFASVFAILSLLITGIVQVIRQAISLNTRRLEKSLLNLFGEMKHPEHFVAAILTHPTLAGERGRRLYLTLTDPQASPIDVEAAIKTVLRPAVHVSDLLVDAVPIKRVADGHPQDERPASQSPARRGMFQTAIAALYPWSTTDDLDKQTVKDVSQAIYEQIGHIVDPEDPKRTPGSTMSLRNTREKDDLAKGVRVHRGRVWALATAAFPEAEGKAPALKTYVAAFFEEAYATASDWLSWRMRWISILVAVVVVFAVQINALDVWKRMASTSNEAIGKLEQTASSLSDRLAKAGVTEADKAEGVETIRRAATAASEIGVFAPEPGSSAQNAPSWYSLWPLNLLVGKLLAVAALSVGAPFWFEILKGGIQMKSAFSKDSKAGQ